MTNDRSLAGWARIIERNGAQANPFVNPDNETAREIAALKPEPQPMTYADYLTRAQDLAARSADAHGKMLRATATTGTGQPAFQQACDDNSAAIRELAELTLVHAGNAESLAYTLDMLATAIWRSPR